MALKQKKKIIFFQKIIKVKQFKTKQLQRHYFWIQQQFFKNKDLVTQTNYYMHLRCIKFFIVLYQLFIVLMILAEPFQTCSMISDLEFNIKSIVSKHFTKCYFFTSKIIYRIMVTTKIVFSKEYFQNFRKL